MFITHNRTRNLTIEFDSTMILFGSMITKLAFKFIVNLTQGIFFSHIVKDFKTIRFLIYDIEQWDKFDLFRAPKLQ